MMKILIILSVMALLWGCTTFGNFANLNKGESTRADVSNLLGEPLEKRFEKDQEVWKYRFVEESKKECVMVNKV